MKFLVAILFAGSLLMLGAENGITSPAQSTLSIYLYACAQDSGQTPELRYRADPRGYVAHREIEPATSVARFGPGVWHLSAKVPTGRWYLRVFSEHCTAFLTTTSIDGEGRTFLTATLPHNDDGPALYPATGFLAGSLPYPGFGARVFESRECSTKYGTLTPAIEGRYFYFDELWKGDYCLMIGVGGIVISQVVHVPVQGTIVRITTNEIREAMQSEH